MTRIKTPKTGLAKQLRAWMRKRRKPFSPAQAAKGVGVPPGPGREKVRDAIRDAVRRNEVRCIAPGQYRYNAGWKPAGKASIKPRLLKAMYVCHRFATSDLARLIDSTRMSHVRQTVQTLVARGYLRQDGRRVPAAGIGTERIWIITDRDRFKLELMS